MHVLGSEGRYVPSLGTPSVQALLKPTSSSCTRIESTGLQSTAEGQQCAEEEGVGSAGNVCNHCIPARHFQTEDALHQHLRAKHLSLMNGSEVSVIGKCTQTMHHDTTEAISTVNVDANDAKRSSIENIAVGDGDGSGVVVECPACGLMVSCIREHMASFKPPAHPDLACECNKVFHSERALNQHRNFCSIVCSEPITVVQSSAVPIAAKFEVDSFK